MPTETKNGLPHKRRPLGWVVAGTLFGPIVFGFCSFFGIMNVVGFQGEKSFAGNVILSAIIGAIVGVIIDIRRNGRPPRWRFTLIELFLFVLAMAIFFFGLRSFIELVWMTV